MYSFKQKQLTINTYYNLHSIRKTIRILEYPARRTLEAWINEYKKSGCIKESYSTRNAACEAFFGRLKTEMFYNHSWVDASIEDFVNSLDNYIHWYASGRIKMSLGALSPMEYRRSLGLVS